MMMTSQQPPLHMIQQSLQMTSSTDELRIDLLRQVDVLCGRGKMCFHHKGNDKFRMLIADHADTYQMAPTKKAKMQVVMLIVDIVIARGGRFLIDNKDGTWADGGRKQGKKKTGHAFRDALRGRVKCITQMRAQNAHSATLSAADDSTLSNSASHGSSDGFDLDGSDYFDPTPIGPNFTVEPSNEWSSSKIDRATASDLLNFFIAEQLEDAAAEHVQSHHI
jgi:hypothetical protein